jgi:uncharacterized protein
MHLRERLRRYLPTRDTLHRHDSLRVLNTWLHDPEIWHLTRRSTAGAASAGVFIAFIPVPMQMLLAALAAVILRVNLPVAVTCAWVTNPFTTPPLSYLAYRIGAWLLGLPPGSFHFELSWHWLTDSIRHLWQPFLLGSIVLGAVAAILANVLVRLLWRLHLVNRWKARRRSGSGATGTGSPPPKDPK